MCRPFEVRYSLVLYESIGIPSGINDLTRQLSFLMNNYKYDLSNDPSGGDPDNACIMIPRYKALGRTAPNGQRYPDREVARPSEDDLVPVRSIITKYRDRDIVTPDLIGTKFKDLTPGSALGTSFSTSLTESITQSALGLKHGGHERVLDETGYLKAPKACTIREDGNWLYLDIRGGKSLKYPRPKNLVLTGKDKYQEGELIGTAYATTSPIYKLNALIKLMRAKGQDGTRYFEKDNVIVSDCYAYETGKISYTENKNKEIEVHIGTKRYEYNPDCMYYYPEGTEIKKFQRFCSGVVNMSHVVVELKTNINDIYSIFRKQFYTLIEPGFTRTGISDLHSTQEELVEMLFISLSKVTLDLKDLSVKKIDYQGTHSGVMDNDSFYTILSYGYPGRVIAKALKKEVYFKGDIMTETVLGLLLNDKLDEKQNGKN